MALRTYPRRFLLVSAISSALLLLLCVTVAVYLVAEQRRTADDLEAAITRRTVAINTEETIADLIPLQRTRAAGIDPLLLRMDTHLAEIRRIADRLDERILAEELAASYATFRRIRERADVSATAAAELSAFLRGDTLPACRRLREFYTRVINESEDRHRDALRATAVGLVVVGGLGSVAGLVLGFGLARGLRREVDQILVRVEGASEMLGQELPAVELHPGSPDIVRDQVDELVGQVEKAVQKLQQQEREVMRSERLAALGQLAAGVAHEIRNPMTAVHLLVQTARNDPSTGGLTDEDLALIDDELARVERTLKTYLDYARPPTPERVPCDPAAVVQDALALIRGRADQQQVVVTFHPPPAGVETDADPGLLRQVVVNLLMNALDAMPVGGSLDVSVDTTPDLSVVELAVGDTGAGIAPDMLPRLFQPFSTGKETGLGLGLVVSRRIVEDHGGTITGFNLPDGGACFVARLPARPAA